MNLAGKRFGRCSPAGSHDDTVRRLLPLELGHFTFGHPRLQTPIAVQAAATRAQAKAKHHEHFFH
jgi:hypothetical protein